MIGVTSSYATYTLTVTPPKPYHITASGNNVDLSTLLGIGPGVCAGNDTVYVDAGVIIGSTSATSPAMTTGNIPAGSGSLTIINNGSVIGAGGNGGVDPGNITSASCPTTNGQNGGDAIFIANSIVTKIINNGTIAGGGGGGGAGQSLSGVSLSSCIGNDYHGASGGGGAGTVPGLGGTDNSCNVGTNGTANAGGAGGLAPASGGCGCPGFFGFLGANSGVGGQGGALGAAGAPGGSSSAASTGTCPGGVGGLSGNAINGNGCSCATESGAGTTLGPVKP
jgi:hypothetical protein